VGLAQNGRFWQGISFLKREIEPKLPSYNTLFSTHTPIGNLNTFSSMAPTHADHQNLINQFEAMAVRQNSKRAIQLYETEIINTDWNCCLIFKVLTAKPVVFPHLKEALFKSWGSYDLLNVTRFVEGLYVA
jgi:hypothetical protein